MSDKFKPRQQKLPRNWEVVDMLLGRKGGPHKDRRDKRSRRDRDWKDEVREYVTR